MEFFLDKLLPEHTLNFVENIMSLHGDLEYITPVNNGKSALVKYSSMNKNLKKLVKHLEVMRSACFYYDDETSEYWVISLAIQEQAQLFEELIKVKTENEVLQYRIEELEKMLVKLREEHNTAIIMLKDMAKLLK